MQQPPSHQTTLGVSGRIAAAFQANAITPLLALVALLLGLFAVLVTPREEEPQINVTMANVLIAFPGASSVNVQNMVAKPAEQVLSQIAGVEHTYSVSRPGVAVLTVQFKVGVPRTEALVRLYDVLNANQDWLPRDLGTLPPIVKPKGIDDVPVLALTANVNTEDHQRCKAVGMNALVLKPFERQRLCTLIEEHLLLSPAFLQRLQKSNFD